MKPKTNPRKTTVAAGFRPRRGSSRATRGLRAIARKVAVNVQTNSSRICESRSAMNPSASRPRTIFATAVPLISMVIRRRVASFVGGSIGGRFSRNPTGRSVTAVRPSPKGSAKARRDSDPLVVLVAVIGGVLPASVIHRNSPALPALAPESSKAPRYEGVLVYSLPACFGSTPGAERDARAQKPAPLRGALRVHSRQRISRTRAAPS